MVLVGGAHPVDLYFPFLRLELLNLLTFNPNVLIAAVCALKVKKTKRKHKCFLIRPKISISSSSPYLCMCAHFTS